MDFDSAYPPIWEFIFLLFGHAVFYRVEMSLQDTIQFEIVVEKWVSDEPQPGIVEFSFKDAWGQTHHFQVKSAIVVYSGYLYSDSVFPIFCKMAGKKIRKWIDDQGRHLVTVSTYETYYEESKEGQTEFDLLNEEVFEQ